MNGLYFADKEYKMNKRVNFEDNTFILMMRIRMIRDTITLDADPELFLEKTLDDIYFTENTLRILLEYLQDNNYLIEREEYLENFSELEWQFSQVLRELLEHNGNFSIQGIASIREKLNACRNNSLQRRKTADNLSPAAATPTNSPIVSSDELTQLLKAL